MLKTMSEHRVRPARHKGQLNFEQELIQALYAFGDDKNPLPETVRVLDEIVTDFIIDTVHTASRAATLTGRQKVKTDDFNFAIRHDEVALGRVKELFAMERSLKAARKQFDTDEGKVGVGRGRGRRKQVDIDAEAASKANLLSGRNSSKAPPDDDDNDDDDSG